MIHDLCICNILIPKYTVLLLISIMILHLCVIKIKVRNDSETHKYVTKWMYDNVLSYVDIMSRVCYVCTPFFDNIHACMHMYAYSYDYEHI